MLTTLALLVGCATRQKGPAYGAEQEFRRQLETNRVVTYYGYKVQEVRFSGDYEKALVVFAPKSHPEMRPEVVLEHNGFGKYEGTLYLTETGAKDEAKDVPETTVRVVFSPEMSPSPNRRSQAIPR